MKYTVRYPHLKSKKLKGTLRAQSYYRSFNKAFKKQPKNFLWVKSKERNICYSDIPMIINSTEEMAALFGIGSSLHEVALKWFFVEELDFESMTEEVEA